MPVITPVAKLLDLMRLSTFFMPTMRHVPANASAVSHRLMLKSGMIKQMSAGIYTWLPLGFRVLEKVTALVAKAMDEAGVARLLMPTLQPQELWRKSGRLDGYGKELLRMRDRHGRGLLYSPTNEEMVADLGGNYLKSYRELPLRIYQIQWKFRDEIRPRSGVMRAREFLMKDAYSFDEDEEAATISYDMFFASYMKLFRSLGLEAVAVRADSGQIGGSLSHEFHILAESGESELYFTEDYRKVAATVVDESGARALRGLYAVEGEVHDAKAAPKTLRRAKGIEVGHVFYFGTRYSEKMGVAPSSALGDAFHPHMGSYGIGIARLVAALIEASHDEAGIVWHKTVAPFGVAVINLKGEDETCAAECERIYERLKQLSIDPLYDDRPIRPGAKFADMELVGIPWQLVVAPQELAQGKVLLKCRRSGERQALTLTDAMRKLNAD